MSPKLPEAPQEQQQEIIPPSPAPSRAPASNKKRIITAFAFILGPPTLMILTILAYAFANFIFGSTSTELFAEPSTIETVINITLFIVGGLTIIAALPCFIFGIILLFTRKVQ